MGVGWSVKNAKKEGTGVSVNCEVKSFGVGGCFQKGCSDGAVAYIYDDAAVVLGAVTGIVVGSVASGKLCVVGDRQVWSGRVEPGFRDHQNVGCVGVKLDLELCKFGWVFE